jgi:predicted peroxiredoxin
MARKPVISLSTGLEDLEKLTAAFLVAVGAAESGRPTVLFRAKEAVQLWECIGDDHATTFSYRRVKNWRGK